METTARYEMPLLITGQGGKEITHNEALVRIDALLGTRVASRARTTPPEEAVEGGCFLVAGQATGDWQGQDGKLAIPVAGEWRFVPLGPGVTIWVDDEASALLRTHEGWRRLATVSIAPSAVQAPQGGTVIDPEARRALVEIMTVLRNAGLLAA